MSNIAVVGTGYVGLVSGACLADFGNHVTCIDVDAGKIERLKRREIPIVEQGLDDVVARTRQAGRLTFTTDLAVAAPRRWRALDGTTESHFPWWKQPSSPTSARNPE